MRIRCISSKPTTESIADAFEDARVVAARLAEDTNVAVAACWKKIIEFLDRLDEIGPTGDLDGWISGLGYELMVLTGKNTIVIRIDRFDYGACIDGVPIFHYRVEVKDGGRVIRETRRESADEMVEVILSELGYRDD